MSLEQRIDNIEFKSEGILKRFDGYRDKWEDFYPSEKWAFDKLARNEGGLGRVLDVGCAVGGLGLALSSKFFLKEYVGVDINAQAIGKASENRKRFTTPVKFEHTDILKTDAYRDQQFDTVVSLSCADWNINTNEIIAHCWEALKPGGNFVISLRLTPQQGINDISRSYQPIAHDENGNPSENANYVVFNWNDFLKLVKELSPAPSKILAYGYWGKPSADAVTIYEKLIFAVCIIQKSTGKEEFETELNLPIELLGKSDD